MFTSFLIFHDFSFYSLLVLFFVLCVFILAFIIIYTNNLDEKQVVRLFLNVIIIIIIEA